jgi:hypothetical protein
VTTAVRDTMTLLQGSGQRDCRAGRPAEPRRFRFASPKSTMRRQRVWLLFVCASNVRHCHRHCVFMMCVTEKASQIRLLPLVPLVQPAPLQGELMWSTPGIRHHGPPPVVLCHRGLCDKDSRARESKIPNKPEKGSWLRPRHSRADPQRR